MSSVTQTKSARIRSKLSHPVLDCDGHWLEPLPIFLDYIEKVGGASAADSYRKIEEEYDFGNRWYAMSEEERQAKHRVRPTWWAFPANTLDRATAMMPDLLGRRLDEFGIDFAIVLPTRNNPGGYIEDPALRRVVVRASNLMNAEMFAPYSDRMTPAALITTNTPEEAIEEAEYVVKELGLKVAVLNTALRRPIGEFANGARDRANAPYFIDNLALDSAYDYDPLWAKLVELKVAAMNHTASISWVDRSSPTNFVANHVGHFAQAAHCFARAVYLGGVTRRFPTLKFGFLECGVAWARILCSDLESHWEKRNGEAMLANLRPSNLDLDRMRQLFDQYGGPTLAGRSDELIGSLDLYYQGVSVEELTRREVHLDDYAAVDVHSKEEVANEFARNFYFGCESDDPMTFLAFDPRLKPRLKPMFSSDVSHFDVTDMTEVLEEAYELVEKGFMDDNDFREFAFSNTVELHGGTNPDFFKGTVVEQAVNEELERQATVAGQQ
jgi:predicted TIM-barrel fold metal-dependent hydrolase